MNAGIPALVLILAVLAGDDGATTRPATAPAGLAPGARVRVYDVGEPMDRLLELAPDQTPNFEHIFDALNLSGEQFGGTKQLFRAVATATLLVPEEGQYDFRLYSDDGSLLLIDERPVIIHDGNHQMIAATGIAQLSAGLHSLRLEYFQNTGDAAFKLQWRRKGGAQWEVLDRRSLFVDPTLTPVISPGKKMLMREAALLRPGDGVSLESVHPFFSLVEIRPKDFEPQVGAMAFLPDGRLAVATFEPINEGTMEEEPNGTVWALANVTDDRDGVKVTKIADDLYDPAGMAVVNGRLLVCETTRLTELIDRDGDGFYETHKTVAEGWITDNYHHFTFGLAVDPVNPRFAYIGLSSSIYISPMMTGPNALHPLNGEQMVGLNGPCPPNRCSIAKIDLETGHIEYIAGGMRTPDGLGFGAGGALFATENQGAWMPASKLNEVRPGHFYGYYPDMRPWNHYPNGGHPTPFQPAEVDPQNYTRPALFLPQNEIHNSPTQPLLIPDEERYGPYRGQLLIGELTRGGVNRAFLEKVGGWHQGAVFRFTQGLEGGVHRLAWGPDGALYVGMTGYEATWSWRGTKMGLQKLVPTGEVPFEMLSMSARPDGFEITFTQPADPAYLADPENFRLKTWTYVPGPEYGGEKIDEHVLKATSAQPSADGTRVRLIVPGLQEGYLVHLRTDPNSKNGKRIWTTEAWYTLNRIPAAGSPE